MQQELEDEQLESVDELVNLGESLIAGIFTRKLVEELKQLIDRGAPLWYQDEEGNSALHAAAHVEDQSLVDLLIEKGAVWNLGYFQQKL